MQRIINNVDPSSTDIVHVISSLNIAAAGTTTSLLRLARAQSDTGHSVRIWNVDRAEANYVGDIEISNYSEDFDNWPALRKLKYSSALDKSVRQLDLSKGVTHIHGLWRFPNTVARLKQANSKRKYILSTHGMLARSALAFSSAQKKLFGVSVQNAALRKVDCFHVTSEQELCDVRSFGIRSPIALVPFGFDEPENGSSFVRRKSGAKRVALFLGRLHPIKGLETLLISWSKVEQRFSEWELLLIGPSDESYLNSLKGLRSQLALKNVKFLPPAFGDEKQEYLRGASLLVLPSKSENFGMVVGEALAAGLPAIATKGTPWAGLHDHECGWWIDQGESHLTNALAEAMSLSSRELEDMGGRGRSWVRQDFSWERVNTDFSAVHNWLLEGQAAPSHVHL